MRPLAGVPIRALLKADLAGRSEVLRQADVLLNLRDLAGLPSHERIEDGIPLCIWALHELEATPEARRALLKVIALLLTFEGEETT
jgi:hypothetical protein